MASGGNSKKPILPRPTPAARESASSETLSSTEGHGAQSKRISTSAACRPCQTRRGKCDGNRPRCQACITKGTECRYDVLRGQTRTEARKLLIEQLQSDNSAMREMLWFLQNQPAPIAHRAMDHLRALGTVEPSELRRNLADWVSSEAATPTTPTALVGPTLLALPERPCSPPLNNGTIATVGAVRGAIDIFYRSTGPLFYVIPQDQVPGILAEVVDQFPDDITFADVLGGITTLGTLAYAAEVCGMAAVGLLYLRVSAHEQPPPVEFCGYFYTVTKHLLDHAVQSNPLRAMRVCCLLAIYNIILKGRVALMYIELGLGLARSLGLDNDNCPPGVGFEEYFDYKKTWRTLLLLSGWLAASLGHVSAHQMAPFHLLGHEKDASHEDIIQRELVKVSVIKSRMIHSLRDPATVDHGVVNRLGKELMDFKDGLPEWTSLATLLDLSIPHPRRHVIFYLHLFYLSAVQLLYRRAMAYPQLFDSSSDRNNLKDVLRDGLEAARIGSRVIGLMLQEGAVVQLCWMCIYLAYTSAVIVLHSMVQRLLGEQLDQGWMADLKLVQTCLHTLQFCAEVDQMAGQLRETIVVYADMVEAEHNLLAALDAAGSFASNPGDDESVDILLARPRGDTMLHKAGRDLLRLVQQPFGGSLEVVPKGGPQTSLEKTLVSWPEASVGAPLEWGWELKGCSFDAGQEGGSEETCEGFGGEVNTGQFAAGGGQRGWGLWTPDATVLTTRPRGPEVPAEQHAASSQSRGKEAVYSSSYEADWTDTLAFPSQAGPSGAGG